ncbi:MAG: hypothetical protein KF908_15175 [Nitrosomonas sp.]|nr:hypothetical protein [Nitrosomonas sp.]MCW5608989.1 hypothetical protein [Nitrosomonas sp.]
MNRNNETRCRRFVLARNFAESHGIRIDRFIHYCETGRVSGARFDKVLWQWVVYLPVKLLSR